MADKGSAKEFLLGTQASNLWLYTCEACANEKIIRRWEIEYGEGKISRNKIEECYKSWEGHAKHGDTRALRQAMRRRLNEALARAEIKRAAANPPPLRPGQSARRVQRYGKVTFCHSQGKHSEAR